MWENHLVKSEKCYCSNNYNLKLFGDASIQNEIGVGNTLFDLLHSQGGRSVRSLLFSQSKIPCIGQYQMFGGYKQ